MCSTPSEAALRIRYEPTKKWYVRALDRQFRLLGPVEARIGGAAAALGGPRQRSVLAILLLHAGQVVPSERLIDLLWGESAPPTAATALQGYVSQLRKVIEPDRSPGAPAEVLATAGSGYVARVGPAELDALRFEELVATGRTALGDGRPAAAAEALAEGLALWHGPALADVQKEAFAQDAIRRLDEL